MTSATSTSSGAVAPSATHTSPTPTVPSTKLPLLGDANGVQLALQEILDSILANKMDLRRAQILLYGLQTASANVKHTYFNARSDTSTELL